ncbi:MAG: response regulator transcription factor [Saprospiraceae bacterium]|nr:response regulator transcription factor [Saprospiraceae bacterium]
MKVVIVEDEHAALTRLKNLVTEIKPTYEIIHSMQGVHESVLWFTNNPAPDLLFMDIQLSDGLSFNIFNQVQITCPIIFTTAYDEYALRAFKVNSIDYLLKPIDDLELSKALAKHEARHLSAIPLYTDLAKEFLQAVHTASYKSRFLVKTGNTLKYLSTEDIGYFYSQEGITFAKSTDGKRHIVDTTLEQIEHAVDPKLFFRINRKVMLHIRAVESIHPHLISRLAVRCRPAADFTMIVARERVAPFKKWLDT